MLLAFAARETSTIHLGPLLVNPATRHPTVTVGSIATVDVVSAADSNAEGRAILGLGIGDTAVRLAGVKPARVAALEDSTRTIRSLLHGEAVAVGADRPAQLPYPRPVPVWIAAAGPRSLRSAGRVADGVFIRVGLHPTNLHAAVDQIRAGADE